ncbi:BSP-domain-containing protein [Hyaloscypha bicolor E]|uniref:BSP-domain-containing protein n=1 Tax=Hyaloscypha bicolor E TaxID=1095630 RepID=A0A2J6SHP0_9HELO|nr:BSP-domain-containing protein [Hyaloscypha bicolor E]PMD50273.1 BSP-domain-containing protein [Hyaloscypha bicolor E]
MKTEPPPPGTSPLPPLVFMPAQSSRTSGPAPTSVPRPTQKLSTAESEASSSAPSSKAPAFPLPKLRLEIRDLNHAGAEAFLQAVIASNALSVSVKSVLELLYHSPDSPTTTVPPTRSVTLILRPMDGVAYTTGSDLDSDHKEIHFSLDYIRKSISHERKTDEIMGVLTHEMVHCYQYNAFGTCPGGLIEGIADWVRLNADLSPPHWKKEATGKWDAGYQHTGYFLEYLEQRFGKGTVRRMNEKLRIQKYEEKRFWTELLGRPVEQLWGDYSDAVEKETKTEDDEECVIVEKLDASTPKSVEESATPATKLEDEQ